MSSIWLIILLLFCCNGNDGGCAQSAGEDRDCGGRNSREDNDCGCNGRNSRGDNGISGGRSRENRSREESDCGCSGRNSDNRSREREDRDCDRSGDNWDRGSRYASEPSPFSPLNRMDRDETDYPSFRGNNGPCGCEENNS